MLLRGSQRLFSSSDKKPARGLHAVAATPAHAMSEAPAPSEPELALRLWLANAARGDRGAAEQLLRALLPRVRNLVRYFVRGDAEVDDLAQESLVTILRALPGYRGEGSVHSWADRIVVRVVFAQLRRTRASHKLLVEYKPELLELPANESAQRFLARRQAVRALDELPDEQRDVLVMHHVMGLSVREIAGELDTAFETVRSRLRLGMARLRAALGSDDDGAQDDSDGGAQ
ncbi:MAG: polymerase sigma-70 factor, subfamily [Myxococcaceae bacterium]|nr:polymerase sigma-70 factor, subfamily [Myxococcaceae bacterium]